MVKKMKIAIGIAAAVILLFTAFVAMQIFKNAEPYAAVASGKKIYISEFSVYFIGQIEMFERTGGEDIWEMDFDGEPTADVAKQNTLDNILLVRECVKQADKLGISLTEEEKNKAYENASDLFARISPALIEKNSITLQKLNNIMYENAIYEKVYLHYTNVYEPSEAEIQEFIDSYLLDNPDADTDGNHTALREYFITRQKQDFFLAQYSKWSENMDVSKNTAVWEQIMVDDFKPEL